MFPFLRPLGALRLRKREVVEFFDSVLNSAIKIRQEGKEVSISNSFSIYSTSSLNARTISINSVRDNGPVVNDIHRMWLPHYLAERLVNTGVPNVIGTRGGIRLPFNDLSQKLSYDLYLKDIVDHTFLRATTCKSLHGSPPWSGPIVDNYRTEIYLKIVHISIFGESIVTCHRITFNLWSQWCSVCTGSRNGCPAFILSSFKPRSTMCGLNSTFFTSRILFTRVEICGFRWVCL